MIATGPSTPAGLLDAGATVLEGMTMAAALVLLRRSRPPSPATPKVAAILALITLPAMLSSSRFRPALRYPHR